VLGPGGPVIVVERSGSDQDSEGETQVTVDDLGRYLVKAQSGEHERIVTIDPAEILQQPQTAPADTQRSAAFETAGQVDASREFAVALLAVLLLELLLRGTGRLRRLSHRGRPSTA
jgi:hypothetical protein